MRAQVDSNPALQRDLSSNAIINTDRSAYLARIAHKEAVRAQKEEISDLKSQLEDLKKIVEALTSK